MYDRIGMLTKTFQRINVSIIGVLFYLPFPTSKHTIKNFKMSFGSRHVLSPSPSQLSLPVIFRLILK